MAAEKEPPAAAPPTSPTSAVSEAPLAPATPVPSVVMPPPTAPLAVPATAPAPSSATVNAATNTQTPAAPPPAREVPSEDAIPSPSSGGGAIREGEPEPPAPEKEKKVEKQKESVALRDSRIPRYYFVRPQIGLSLLFTPNAFGGKALLDEQGTHPAYGISALLEYQPAFIQSFGVLGIGPSFTVYPVTGSVTPGFFSLISVGAQARYQLRYFRQQPIVPMVAYAVEFMSYNYSGVTPGTILSHGPVLGVWILLNFLEPSAAASAYVSTKIARTYLLIEWKNMRGQNDVMTINGGGSWYAGIRFEF